MRERDRLDEISADLPWDRPDDARREAVRSSLLVAAAETRTRGSFGRWIVVGGAFACGAAAAVLAVALWPRDARRGDEQLAHIESSSAAQLEQTFTRTATGSDEVVRVHAGRVRLAVGDLRQGDHVRVATADAVVEGAGSYEVAVANDTLSEVTVHSGTATLHINGHQAVFLAAGQIWHASITTADLHASQPAPPSAPSTPPGVSDSSRVSALGSSSSVPDASAGPNGSTVSTGSIASTASISPRRTTSASNASTAPNISSASAGSSDARTADDRTAGTRAGDARTAGTRTGDSRAGDSRTAGTRTGDARTGDVRTGGAAAPGPGGGADSSISIGGPPSTTARGARAQTPTEMHLQAGWALLREGKAVEAAQELGKAADTGEGDLAADARYFQGVALIRAGQTADAERALVAFLDHAPKSIRRGRAAVMLGRLLATRGDLKSARAWFESALLDHDPSVVTAARAAIGALP